MSGNPVTTTIHPSAKDMAARMASKARKIAMAKTENRLRKRAGDASRWREPTLLWPLLSEEK